MFNIGFSRGYPVTLDATTEFINSSSFPKKFIYPYWMVHSDIVSTNNEILSESINQCVGIVPRNYSAGDFAYAFESSTQFIVTNPCVVTQITTEILNSDLTSSDVDEQSIVLFKITKNLPQFEKLK